MIETLFAGTAGVAGNSSQTTPRRSVTRGSQPGRSSRWSYQGGVIMTRALIVADPQRDFCEGGSLGVAGGAAAVSRIDSLLRSEHGYAHVIATRDHHIDPGASLRC